MKNVKKIIMALVLGVTLSSIFTGGEKVSAYEYYPWEEPVKITNDKFWLSKDVGYRLNVEGAAGMSRFYSLSKTSDSGEEWTVINKDPFNGRLGEAFDISFIDEKLGFICLSHDGNMYGQLYRTEDGGQSFEEVSFPETCGDLDYTPFVVPYAPYEEDGSLYVLVGKGDYYGAGSKGLYKSEDNGLTWEFVKEVYPEMID